MVTQLLGKTEIEIFIKNNISHFERVDLTLDSGNLELICIEINGLHCRPFLLSAWYRTFSVQMRYRE